MAQRKCLHKHWFKNWKAALEKSKGLLKHADSRVHIIAMAIWREKELRESSQIEVSTLVCAVVLEKNRYYIRSIAEIVQFLAVNELALLGNYDIDENMERGLFRNLFLYT